MKKFFLIFFCLILFSRLGYSLELRIQYPAKGDTVDQVKIRLAGWVSDTTAVLSVNGEPNRVYPSGAFVDLLILRPGWNDFIIKAVAAEAEIADTLRIYRQPPLQALPESPVSFASDNLLPASEMIYHAPDMIILQFRGSPGGSAFFEIDDLTDDPLPMEEMQPGAAGGMHGIYRGIYMIRENDYCEHEPVIFTLVDKNGDDAEWETDRYITVGMNGQPVIAETRSENNIIFNGPWSEIIMELPAEIRFPVIAEMDRWVKIQISSNLTGLISRRDVEILPAGALCMPVRINGFSSQITDNWLTFSFRTGERIPFDIRQDGSNRLVVDLYRTTMHDEWTTVAEDDAPWQPDSSFLESFTWEQITDENLRFCFNLRTAQSMGF